MHQLKPITVLGVFVADTSYRADRAPKMGETILGNSFALGPGGKGSNQSVAIGRLGGDVHMITRLARDAFGQMALDTWSGAGVNPCVIYDETSYTGAANIFIDETSGDNAIIVCAGAGANLSPDDLEEHRALIANSCVFITQLEQPLPAALKGLQIARENRVATILNPAPAAPLNDEFFKLSDYITPNETEAGELTGMIVESLDDARRAGDALLAKGVGMAVITLGENGVLLHAKEQSEHINAVKLGPVVETTGAGDAFNGAFSFGLACGLPPKEAARLGCVTAGISVTRAGTAASMPLWEEVQTVLDGN